MTGAGFRVPLRKGLTSRYESSESIATRHCDKKKKKPKKKPTESDSAMFVPPPSVIKPVSDLGKGLGHADMAKIGKLQYAISLPNIHSRTGVSNEALVSATHAYHNTGEGKATKFKQEFDSSKAQSKAARFLQQERKIGQKERFMIKGSYEKERVRDEILQNKVKKEATVISQDLVQLSERMRQEAQARAQAQFQQRQIALAEERAVQAALELEVKAQVEEQTREQRREQRIKDLEEGFKQMLEEETSEIVAAEAALRDPADLRREEKEARRKLTKQRLKVERAVAQASKLQDDEQVRAKQQEEEAKLQQKQAEDLDRKAKAKQMRVKARKLRQEEGQFWNAVDGTTLTQSSVNVTEDPLYRKQPAINLACAHAVKYNQGDQQAGGVVQAIDQRLAEIEKQKRLDKAARKAARATPADWSETDMMMQMLMQGQ